MTFDVYRPPDPFPDRELRALIAYLQYLVGILEDHESRITTLEP